MAFTDGGEEFWSDSELESSFRESRGLSDDDELDDDELDVYAERLGVNVVDDDFYDELVNDEDCGF